VRGQRFIVKQGDLLPVLEGTCLDSAGAAVNLTTAASVGFYMTPERGGLRADLVGAGAVGDPVAGKVEYVWRAGDTDTPGLYRAEFRVVWLDGSSETFPTDGYVAVEVQRRATA
jgi:hypothetical protein